MTLTAPYFDGTQPCRHHNPDMWYANEHPKELHSLREAIRLCGECPFRAPCAQWAVDNDEQYGVWGGLTERARAGRITTPTTRPGPTHGKVHTYTQHLCRCDACSNAWDANLLKQRERRRENRRAAKADYMQDARQKQAS